MPILWLDKLFSMMQPYSFGVSLGILALLWVVLYIRYHVFLINPVLDELEHFSDFLTGLGNMEEKNEARITDYIIQTKENSFLQTVWNEYIENRSADPDLNQYFNNNTLANAPAKRSKAVFIPSFLVTFGLVISFFCLAAQVSLLQSGEYMPGLFYSVISQMAVIAVFSILISYVFGLLNKLQFDKIDAKVLEISKILKRKLPVKQGENIYERIAGSIDNMTSSLSSYAQYTVDMQRSGMNQLVDIFLESLHNRMNDQLDALNESFENLTSIQLQSAAQAEALVGELVKGNENQRQINATTESIVSSIAQYHEQITESSLLLSEGLKDLQKLSEALSGIVSFNSAALQAVQKEREILRDEYSRYIKGIYDLFEQYHSKASDELEKTLSSFTEAANNAYSQMEGTVIRSIEDWTGNSKSIMQSMEEHNRSLQFASREIAQHINELNASLKASVLEFTEAMEKGTGQTIRQFDEGLSEITMRLSRTILDIRDAVDDLPVVIDSLKRSLE